MSVFESKRRWDVYANQQPTEIHTEDCESAPTSMPTGDATENVLHRPDDYSTDGETISVSCGCLNDVLGEDR
jgi:hypothetical protein